jgi:hypothetical protein
MIGVSALAPNDGTVFAGVLDVGCRAFKGGLTNTTHFVVGVPTPLRDAVVSLDADPKPRRGGTRVGPCRSSRDGRPRTVRRGGGSVRAFATRHDDDDGG